MIPAGSAGEGEVIHAARSGIGGKPGELLVTARFVRVGDREVRLRSFSLGAKGHDRSDASLATSIVTGPFGLFVVGGVMIIPRGTVAGAKTAVEIQLPAVAPTSAPAGQPPVDKPKGGDDENEDIIARYFALAILAPFAASSQETATSGRRGNGHGVRRAARARWCSSARRSSRARPSATRCARTASSCAS